MIKQNKKEVQKTSLNYQDTVYEMVYSPYTQSTEYIGYHVENGLCTISEIETENCLYKPLSGDHVLLEKGVLLFPSEAINYGTEMELISDIHSYIHKYVDVSEVFEYIATYYVLFTWLYDKFNEVPYLRAIGDFGSGKSRLIQTIGSICYKPIFTAGATTSSPIFRMIDEMQGTLVLDEADFRFSDMTSDIVKILNTGYQRGTPVLRSEGKGVFEVKAYNVYGPKIIATREYFKDQALESRFLVEQMGVNNLRNNIPRTLGPEFYQESLNLRNKLLMWRLRNYFKPIKIPTDIIPNIHPRLNQIVLPLLSIIKDESVKDNLIDFITEYNQEMVTYRKQSYESNIIITILKIADQKKTEKIMIKDIAKIVNTEQNLEKYPISERKLGDILRNKLHLKTERISQGFYISLLNNSKKIDFWKDRFQIMDEDILDEQVNIMNVAKDSKNIEGK